MAERDAAFEWETEALRSSVRRRSQTRQPAEELIEPGWVTIRQAESATGIPVGTLRRWSRQGSLPSRSHDTPAGSRRLVWLDAVLDRAAALGRTTEPVEPVVSADDQPEAQQPAEIRAESAQHVASRAPIDRSAPPPPPRPQPHPQPIPEIPGQQQLVEAAGFGDPVVAESHDSDEQPQPQPQAELEPEPPAGGGEAKTAPPDPPPGTMLVPVDAWNKMLAQLGNLHEAGRDLAEARERAAKAETEASFLRERLKEMRQKDQPGQPDPADQAEPSRRRWLWRR